MMTCFSKPWRLAALFSLQTASVFAQLFIESLANLPNSASGANMDVRAADLDNDGDLDLVFAREFQANFILKNDGAAVFSNGATGNLPQVVHDSEDVAIADFNGDGHLDLVFCSEDDLIHEFYLGDGAGKFTVAPFQFSNSEANAVIVADINADDFPDLFFGNKGAISVAINDKNGGFLYENNRVTQIQRTTQDLAQADVDGDGDLDLMAGNENGNLLFINDGTGNFHDSSATHLPVGLNVETRKLAFGDVDGDDDVDVFLANVQFITGKDPQNRLLLNDGSGHFSDATATHLPTDVAHSVDAIFEDLDLDGDLDLVIANVFGAPLFIYTNNGAGVFSESTMAILGKEYYRDALGVIAADLNADGLRDLYVCHRRTPQNQQKDLLLLRTMPVPTTEAAAGGTLFRVFPNPAGEQFFVQTSFEKLDSLRLFSADGRLAANVAFEKTAPGVFRCSPSWAPGFAQGAYFLSAILEEKTVATARLYR